MKFQALISYKMFPDKIHEEKIFQEYSQRIFKLSRLKINIKHLYMYILCVCYFLSIWFSFIYLGPVVQS